MQNDITRRWNRFLLLWLLRPRAESRAREFYDPWSPQSVETADAPRQTPLSPDAKRRIGVRVAEGVSRSEQHTRNSTSTRCTGQGASCQPLDCPDTTHQNETVCPTQVSDGVVSANYGKSHRQRRLFGGLLSSFGIGTAIRPSAGTLTRVRDRRHRFVVGISLVDRPRPSVTSAR